MHPAQFSYFPTPRGHIPYPLDIPTPANNMPNSVRDVFMANMTNKIRKSQARHRQLNQMRNSVLDVGLDLGFGVYGDRSTRRIEQIRRELHTRPAPQRPAFIPSVDGGPSLAGINAALDAHFYVAKHAPRAARIMEREYIPQALPQVFGALEALRAERFGAKAFPHLPPPRSGNYDPVYVQPFVRPVR